MRVRPSPRPSRSASEVARSRFRGLPHAPQSQPCFTALFLLSAVSHTRPNHRPVSYNDQSVGVLLQSRGDALQSRGPCPRADPPSFGRRASLARWQGRVSAVSHTRPNHSPVSQPCFSSRRSPTRAAITALFHSPVSRLRGLPHAPQSQPCFFTTTSLSGSSYSPAVTLFFICLFLLTTLVERIRVYFFLSSGGWVIIQLKLRHQAG